MTMIVSLAPVPFVTWAPGSTVDLLARHDGKPAIEVSGVTTYPSSGQLLLLTVAQSRNDATVSLPEALLAYVRPHHAVLPREFIYPDGTSQQQQQSNDVQQMNTAQQDAIVAAVRAAGRPVTPMPVVTQVTTSGPANGLLQPGDFVTSVDGIATAMPDDVYRELQSKTIGRPVALSIVRDGAPKQVQISVVGSNQDKAIPVIGARFEVGYAHPEQVNININADVVGSSGGLMFALAIYDRMSAHDLPAGRVIAGTGKIDANGQLGAIGGAPEKLAAAQKAQAAAFLVPTGNCGDLAGVRSSVRIVRVSTLADAITALHDLEDPATASKVPTC